GKRLVAPKTVRIPQPGPATTPAQPPVTFVCRFTAITLLNPRRLTHVAVMPGGQIFWSQETDSGRDMLYSLDPDGKPQATMLTSSTILRTMGAEGGSGNIQSVAPGPQESLLFYFNGGSG